MSLKKLTLSLCVGAAALGSAQARVPYTYPAHQDISQNNYDMSEINKGIMPKKFESKSEISVGQEIMVFDRYHGVYDSNGGRIGGMSMARLDRLQVVDLNGPDDKKIKVKLLSGSDGRMVNKTYYVNVVGLSEYQDFKDFDADIYMIQNIATEKLRVYQRLCKDNSCPPKMIFETDFVSGMKKGDKNHSYNTHVGNYRVFEWIKFYQDYAKHYPSWYDPNYPRTPGPNDSWSDWFDKDVMPGEHIECSENSFGRETCDKAGSMRGAFGWYTALVEPHYGSGQWTHGTIGWGDSSKDMISRARGEDFLGSIASIFTSLRSSGCSRVANPDVAFLRHILPPGTPVIKIYAHEAYQDQNSVSRNYRNGSTPTWQYILTTDGVRAAGEEAVSADRNYVEENNILTNGNVITSGYNTIKSYPSVVQIQYVLEKDNEGREKKKLECVEDNVDNTPKMGQRAPRNSMVFEPIGEKIGGFLGKAVTNRNRCDVYKIDNKTMKGKYYVDTGLLDGYSHPVGNPEVKRGGFRSQDFPDFVLFSNY